MLASDVMTTDFFILDPDVPVHQALEPVWERRRREIPVVEQGRFIGVLTMRELIHRALPSYIRDDRHFDNLNFAPDLHQLSDRLREQGKATVRDAHITITASSGLSEDEIQRMVHQAEEHADEDRQRKEEIEARNMADQAIYAAEKTLRDMEDQVPDEIKTEVEAKVQALQEIKDTGSIEQVRQRTQELGETLQQIGTAAYGAQQGGPGTPPPGGGPQGGPGGPGGPGEGPSTPPDEDVVDGEFSEA